MKIYGVPLSPFSRKVLIALKLKNLDYELVPTMPGTQTPEFLTISPLGKVPALVDGDLTISDSSVICQYLEEKAPQYPLLPETIGDRAKCRWLEEYADSVVAASCSRLFWEVAVKPMLKNEQPDRELVSVIKEQRFPEMASYLETQVPESGFLFGQFGLADISIATHFINASYVDQEVDADKWPKLAAYLEHCWSHQVIKEMMEADKAYLRNL
ncbi:glutathione S-transferase family protein [Motiliproteus sp. MSK22-1]|uniref:glutathione S-transferase family protein n=1 Tax=Motiliproteus sp. MSK22-1 TaxID=1897630 RepID=UPI000977BA19|nr:glutathione S-transferase family protein [Motiliproteus sp. MSK22-1]OMH29463.1 hypothetical protein BGP75_19640 [Motiliproteus sp. MSK22-1]